MKRILCIDDEEHMRNAIFRVCRRRGYEVVLAADGAEGIVHAKSSRFDLIILDILMPGLNGYDVLARLDELGLGETPIILVTGKDGDREVLEGYRRGASYYLTKPFKQETLAAAVDYLVGEISAEDRRALELQL